MCGEQRGTQTIAVLLEGSSPRVRGAGFFTACRPSATGIIPACAGSSLYPNLSRNHYLGCPSCGKNKGKFKNGYVNLKDNLEYECNCQDQLQRHKHYLNAGIGRAYQFLCWADFTGNDALCADAKEFCENLGAHIEDGEGLIMCSRSYGTGKTLAASLIAREAVQLGYNTFMSTWADMLDDKKDGWKDNEFNCWHSQRVNSAQLLVIDDLGKEMTGRDGFNDSFSRQTFDTIIRTRTQRAQATIITTNLLSSELEATYGAAVISLLRERCHLKVYEGSDGSSPRVRGAEAQQRQPQGRPGACRRGIIPACAGSSPYPGRGITPALDHPRVCGEQNHAPQGHRRERGSSPRVRGAAILVEGKHYRYGIIPACAGSSGLGRRRWARVGDHPRVCGEQVDRGVQILEHAGSSPRVRGAAVSPHSS